MPLAGGRHVIRALAAGRAHEPFRGGVRPRPDRRVEYPRAVTGQDVVGGDGELAVPAADQELEPPARSPRSISRLRACRAVQARPDGRPRPRSARSGSGSPSRTTQAGAAAARYRQAGGHGPGRRMPGRPGTAARPVTPAAARDRARRRPGSAGSCPPRPGTPGRAAHPWMRRPPRRGFCRAGCSTSARASAGTGGRPGASG